MTDTCPRLHYYYVLVLQSSYLPTESWLYGYLFGFKAYWKNTYILNDDLLSNLVYVPPQNDYLILIECINELFIFTPRSKL